MTLPDDTLRALNRVDPDTGWAIVKLLELEPRERQQERHQADVELARIATRRSLIVVNRAVFKSLPGVNLIPLSDRRAFLALDPGRGMSDLELVVIDRLSDLSLGERERDGLGALRTQLAAWRRNRRLKFHSRSIIVVEQLNGGTSRGASKVRQAAV